MFVAVVTLQTKYPPFHISDEVILADTAAHAKTRANALLDAMSIHHPDVQRSSRISVFKLTDEEVVRAGRSLKSLREYWEKKHHKVWGDETEDPQGIDSL